MQYSTGLDRNEGTCSQNIYQRLKEGRSLIMYNYYLAILLIILALFILFRGILAFMFSHISELKGYHGLSEWFLVFFLGIYGILYVWMLPYKAEDEVEEENKSIDIQA